MGLLHISGWDDFPKTHKWAGQETPAPQEVEAGGLQVQGPPAQLSDTLSQNKNK